MEYFQLDSLKDNRSLTRAVVQAAQLLNLYNAELASILGLKCADIVDLYNNERDIVPGSSQGSKAMEFIRFYNLLDKLHDSDLVAMSNWLRRKQGSMEYTPLTVIVDQNNLGAIVQYVQGFSHAPLSSSSHSLSPSISVSQNNPD